MTIATDPTAMRKNSGRHQLDEAALDSRRALTVLNDLVSSALS
jgi:hypothetical protein